MMVVLANAIFTAMIKYTHNEQIDRNHQAIYKKIEVRNISPMKPKSSFAYGQFLCHRLSLQYSSIWKPFSKYSRWALKIIYDDRFSNSNLCLPLARRFVVSVISIEVNWHIFKFFVLLAYWNQVRCSKIFSTKFVEKNNGTWLFRQSIVYLFFALSSDFRSGKETRQFNSIYHVSATNNFVDQYAPILFH